MKILLLAACLGVAASTDSSVLYASAPKNRGAYHAHDILGKYHYGYNTGDGIAKIEVKRGDGAVVGSYRYYDPNGKQVIRSYIADSSGFRVLGNDLPIAHESVPAQVHDAPAFTAPVEGTSSFVQPTDQNTAPWARVPGTYEPGHQAKYTSPPWRQLHHSKPSAHYVQQPHHFQQPSQQLATQQQSAPTQTYQPKNIAQQQHTLPQYANPASQTYDSLFGTTNTLTHEMMPSPYLIHGRRLNYDFPAGFAYPGSGTAVGTPPQQHHVQQPQMTQQRGPPYTIGKLK